MFLGHCLGHKKHLAKFTKERKEGDGKHLALGRREGSSVGQAYLIGWVGVFPRVYWNGKVHVAVLE